MAHGEATDLEGVSLTNKLVAKVSLYVAMYVGGEACAGPWSSYVRRGVTPGIFSGKLSLADATLDEDDIYHAVVAE